MVAAGPAPTRAQQLDAECVVVARARHRCDHQLALLLAQLDEPALAELGFRGIGEYAEARLQLTGRTGRALRAIGRVIGGFPIVESAFAAGDLEYTKVREVVKVADSQTEAEWVRVAQMVSCRDLEGMVRAAAKGDPVPEPGTDALEAARGRMVLVGSATDLRQIRELVQMLRQSIGPEAEELTDAEVLALHAQRQLHDWKHGDEVDPPSTERHTVVVYSCASCRKVHGESAEIDDTTVQLASCDGTVVDLREGEDRGAQTKPIPTRTRRTVLHRDRRQCRVPGCTCRLWCDVHHLRARSLGGSNHERNLITLCSAHHRLLHEGRLAVEKLGNELEFRFADGRVVRVMLDPDAPRATHVGRPGRVGSDGPGAVDGGGSGDVGDGREAMTQARPPAKPAPGDPCPSDNASSVPVRA